MSRGAKGDETMTKALARFLAQRLVPDLKERARTPSVAEALRHRWEHERDARRTADLYDPWAARLVEQVGAAWILSCAFVRTLEDRGYLAQRRLAGPGAADSEHYFFELFPQLGARDYLFAIFREMGHLPGAADLFGPDHNAAWRLAPSNPVAQELLALWRSSTEERAPTWTFDGTDTRFLGDLYQWLSEDARERFALLQTPDFVEEFILDLTLNPAIEEFGLETVRVIDPTCGSGHFLLGAFDRLFELRAAAKPGLDRREHALAALNQVYGVDINPYAVEIARFRLTLSFLEKAGISHIADAPALKTNIVVADSLLHGAGLENLRLSDLVSDKREWGDAQFTLDDEPEARRILGQGYHAVVGNPPYIMCKDEALSALYRERYRSCYKLYALAAPFTERFFQLGVPNGFIALINANSFMKREFGKKLVQEVLPHLDVTHVLDTAGAFIPGHGTPTVILAGRNRAPTTDAVRVVMGNRGEPETPADPASGVVWSSIVANINDAGYQDEFISVADVSRSRLSAHPWSLGGGGASELKDLLERRSESTLGASVADVGRTTVCGEDDVWIMEVNEARRLGAAELTIPLVVGESVRDWAIAPTAVIYPYDSLGGKPADPNCSTVRRYLWRYRALLENRKSFGRTLKERDACWYEHLEHYVAKLQTPLSIAFAFVATHNHFALDRGGKVFKQTAPVLKLPQGASEDDYLRLLGYLNTSTACFWMKQVIHKKSSASQKHHTDPARAAYEFASTALESTPIPDLSSMPVVAVRRLVDLGVQRAGWISGDALAKPLLAASSGEEIRMALQAGWRAFDEWRDESLYIQEELDWWTYAVMGLVSHAEANTQLQQPRRAPPGSRPFELLTGYSAGLSERVVGEKVSVERAAIPEHWNARVSLLAREGVALIERREFKRQWRDTERNVDQHEFRRFLERELVKRFAADTVEAAVEQASVPMSARAALSCVEAGERGRAFFAVADFLGVDADALLREITGEASVPYLSTLRYTSQGLDKRSTWERTWELQRLEDAGELNGEPIPPPPKYDSTDYTNAIFWRLRGKLDVAKERFISYPGAERDGDTSPLIGWAGWDHLQRAQALAAVYEQRKTEDGWPKERLVPLLAGILELVPWLKQWHNEPNPEFGDAKLGDYFEGYVTSEASALVVTLDELRAWKPAASKTKRGRKPATKAKEST